MIKNLRKYLILLTVAGAVIACDQLTKMYIHTHFQLGEQVVVWQDYFNLGYVRNTGAAFGILRSAHEDFRSIFFLSMPPIALIIILFILRGVRANDHIQILALSLIFGGAIGNYIDRLRFGYVIDFLEFHWQSKYTWPNFNIADAAIVVGVGILGVLMIRRPD